MSMPTPASAASTMCGRWCAPSRRPASPGCSSATRCSRTAAAICRASRSFRSSRCWPRSRPRSTRARDPDLFIAARTDAAGVEGVEAAIARCQLFMEAGADMAKPMGFDTIPEIKRALREIPGPHMATLSQAAGPKARSLPELEAAGVVAATFPSVRAVRRGECGAQRAAAAQARQFAGAVPGASHSARRLLRARRAQAAAGARGELRQGGRRAGAEARGGMRRTRRQMRGIDALRMARLSSPRAAGIVPWRASLRRAAAQARRGVLQGQADPHDRSASRSATTTTSARGCWRSICPSTFPASRPSSCRTCRRRRASPRPITSMRRRRATAP